VQRYPDPTWYDNDYTNNINEQVKQRKPKEHESAFSSIAKRNFAKSEVTGNKSLAAASIDNLVTVLKTDQLKQCGLAYINNGIVRTIVDRTVYFINPERTDFVIEPNDELTTGSSEDEIKKIEKQIDDDTLTDENGNPLRIKELKQKLTRINKRVKLHSSLDKLLASTLIFGRGALKIVKFPDTTNEDNSTTKGEPRALLHLASMRIKEIIADETTGQFQGLKYDDGKALSTGPTKIKAEELIPAFNDDYNILDNSNYSGLSAVWPVLEAANVIDVILAEDMPEIARQAHSKFGIMYAGTSKKSTIKKLKEELEAGTWLVHNEQQLTADVHDLSLDPMRLMEVINALAKHMSIAMNLPLFMLFEDTTNFATANQVMQVYKTGVLTRYRTWLQGILEDYWYDPILADHLGIDVADVISAPIRIKAIFQDINFETRKDIIDADKVLMDEGVFTNVDTAKDIDRKDIANRLELEKNEVNKAITVQRQQDIQQQMLNNPNINNNGGNQPNKQQPTNNFNKNRNQNARNTQG